MTTVSAITLSPDVNSQITIAPGTVALKVSNTSPYDCLYSGYGTISDDWIPSGTEYLLYGSVYYSGSLSVTLKNNRGISPPNPGVLLIVPYLNKDSIPYGTWPISIPQNIVNTSNNMSATLVNTNSIPNTLIIEIKPTDAAADVITVDNEGNVTFKVNNGGTLTTLLQLIAGVSEAMKIGAASVPVEVLGNLTVDSKINGLILSTLGGGNGVQLGYSTNADCLDQTSSGLYLKSIAGAFAFQSPNGTTRWTRFRESKFSGTGSGTFNHGLGVTPDIILANPATGGGSQTIGFSSLNSTTCVVTTGAGLAWNALAIQF